MFLVMHAVAAVLVVTVGYFVVWTSMQPNTQKGVAGFGKVMAILLFIVAGGMLLCGLIYGPGMNKKMMHGKMGMSMWGMHHRGEMWDEDDTDCGMMKMKEGKMMKEKGESMEKMKEMKKK